MILVEVFHCVEPETGGTKNIIRRVFLNIRSEVFRAEQGFENARSSQAKGHQQRNRNAAGKPDGNDVEEFLLAGDLWKTRFVLRDGGVDAVVCQHDAL